MKFLTAVKKIHLSQKYVCHKSKFSLGNGLGEYVKKEKRKKQKQNKNMWITQFLEKLLKIQWKNVRYLCL